MKIRLEYSSEETQKIDSYQPMYGNKTQHIHFLCESIGTGHLGVVPQGLNWVWEHRTEEMLQMGI